MLFAEHSLHFSGKSTKCFNQKTLKQTKLFIFSFSAFIFRRDFVRLVVLGSERQGRKGENILESKKSLKVLLRAPFKGLSTLTHILHELFYFCQSFNDF